MVYIVYTVTSTTIDVGCTADRTRAEEEYQRVQTYSPCTVRTIGYATRPTALPEVLAALAVRFPGRDVAVRPI